MAERSQNKLSMAVLKAMSVFGGVQVLNILCSIIRTKLVAIWIGPVGMGLFGLYNTAIEMIGAITQLGVRNSAVRDIAASSGSRISMIIVVVRRWAWFLGLLGAFATLTLSPLLSQWTFGDERHIWGFVALSIVLLFNSLTGGELAILQGLQKLKRFANASLIGAVGGLVVSVPMFYYWGIDSIIPSIIVYAIITLLGTFFFRERNKPLSNVDYKTTFNEGKGFVVLGFYMTISSFVVLLSSYIFMSYLNSHSGTDMVGYYQAGFTLVSKYVGLVFVAISVEYYPRLAKVIHSANRTKIFVSHEISIVLWVLMPVIAIFIATDNWIINLLYDTNFEIISTFITGAIIGTVFRVVSSCMAFVIIAKGDGFVYLITELCSSAIGLVFNIIAYNYGGLTALGYSYTGWYLSYALIIYVVYRYRYNLKLGVKIIKLITMATVLGISCIVINLYVGRWATFIVALATIYSSSSYLWKRKSLYGKRVK